MNSKINALICDAANFLVGDEVPCSDESKATADWNLFDTYIYPNKLKGLRERLTYMNVLKNTLRDVLLFSVTCLGLFAGLVFVLLIA